MSRVHGSMLVQKVGPKSVNKLYFSTVGRNYCQHKDDQQLFTVAKGDKYTEAVRCCVRPTIHVDPYACELDTPMDVDKSQLET